MTKDDALFNIGDQFTRIIDDALSCCPELTFDEVIDELRHQLQTAIENRDEYEIGR